MKYYLEQRLQAAREQGGEGLIAELVHVEKEGGRITPTRWWRCSFCCWGPEQRRPHI